MDIRAVCQRVRGVASVRATDGADRADVEHALRSIAEVRSWLTAAEADLAARLADLASFPEQAIAQAARGSLGEAGRVLERSGTLGATPELADALNDGAVTSNHVDAVTKVAKSLEGDQRDRLLSRANELAGVASRSTAAQFRQRLEHEARRLQTDDGTAKFERQQRAARLRRWTDAEGMWCLQGRFDPLTGVRLNARLNAEIEALFAESLPPGCPTDPGAKHEFLAALALARILTDGGVAQRAGRPEFVVVIEVGDEPSADGRAAGDGPGGAAGDGSPNDSREGRHGGPRVDWGLPVEIPLRVMVELFGQADVHTVIVRNGVVLHAPGQLELGRSTRLANRAQRRALRALYATCAIPACAVGFDHCKIHHVHWWRRGGSTDLYNLLPLCVHHHSRVHDAGWVVTLDTNRQLTVRYPDGSVQSTGPPQRRAA